MRKGVRFRLGAYLVRARRGWGLEVEVRAASADGRVHALPPQPLVFFGQIQNHCTSGPCSGSGFGEGRGGSSHMSWTNAVGPRQPKTLMRPYPRSGRKLIRAGQTLTLSVSVYRYGLVGRVVLAVPRRGKPRVTVLAAP